jgi:hypothetical protein
MTTEQDTENQATEEKIEAMRKSIQEGALLPDFARERFVCFGKQTRRIIYHFDATSGQGLLGMKLLPGEIVNVRVSDNAMVFEASIAQNSETAPNDIFVAEFPIPKEITGKASADIEIIDRDEQKSDRLSIALV